MGLKIQNWHQHCHKALCTEQHVHQINNYIIISQYTVNRPIPRENSLIWSEQRGVGFSQKTSTYLLCETMHYGESRIPVGGRRSSKLACNNEKVGTLRLTPVVYPRSLNAIDTTPFCEFQGVRFETLPHSCCQ